MIVFLLKPCDKSKYFLYNWSKN